MTALSGLPHYLDLAAAMGTGESIEKHLHTKQQGRTDSQTLLSLIMMNLAGGDRVEDLRKLEGDLRRRMFAEKESLLAESSHTKPQS